VITAEARRLISPTELARQLGVSTQTLATWRLDPSKTPKFIKLGSKVAYDVEDVARWLEERKRSSTNDQTPVVVRSARRPSARR
jgi:predicted DNA-binding transcriptional regulator AlpA